MSGPLRLPFLYGITDSRATRGLSPAAAALLLVNAGVTLVQIREKSSVDRSRLSRCAEGVAVVRRSGGLAIVNDRCDLALLTSADGVHLGEDDLSPEATRTIMGPGALVGLSTHSAERARRAMESPEASYVALGPIFETRSKESPFPPLGLGAIEEAAKAKSRPLVVIGGITPEQVGACLAAGADSVAMIAGLLDGDPVRNVAESYEAAARAGFRQPPS